METIVKKPKKQAARDQNHGLLVLDQETIPVRIQIHVKKIINAIIHNVVN